MKENIRLFERVRTMCECIKLIQEGGTGEVVEKKSRFIAQIFPIKTEEEALQLLAGVRKKHYDARHNCFAYVLGDNNETERCSDDGEPSGTAGRPMMDVITGRGIHNVLVVVTRYFGGTLLGTGGLVRAYSAAVQERLSDCVIVEKIRGFAVKVTTDYTDVGKIQYIAASRELSEESSEYGEKAEFVYLVPAEKVEGFEQEITEKTGGKSRIERGDETWIYWNT